MQLKIMNAEKSHKLQLFRSQIYFGPKKLWVIFNDTKWSNIEQIIWPSGHTEIAYNIPLKKRFRIFMVALLLLLVVIPF